MKSVKYVMVLWDTELEKTLLKKMNKNLKVEIRIDHYIQTFLSLVRFGGLLKYPLSIISHLNF